MAGVKQRQFVSRSAHMSTAAGKLRRGAQSRKTARQAGAPCLCRGHLGAKIGLFAILHTWGQHHPHLHSVVPGGDLSPDRMRWIHCRPRFFLPVRVLSRFYRRRFLELLDDAFQTGKLRPDQPG